MNVFYYKVEYLLKNLHARIYATHTLFRTSDNRRNLLVTHCLMWKEVLFCCDFKLHFLIKSAKLIFILEFINHSNCRYKSIPRTRLGECCDFGGSVKQRKISIVYVWAIIYLYNPLVKEWHIFLNRCTVGTI